MEALLFLVLVLVVGSVVTAPLRRRGHDSPIDARTAALEAARDAKLREIRDAELDHRTGKLSDDDYRALDATLRGEAATLLRDLEAPRE